MPLGFIAALLINAALSYVIGRLLRPRIKRPKSPNLEFVRAEEGAPIPIGYGRFVVAPNIVWWGNAVTVDFVDPAALDGYLANMVGTLCLGRVSDVLDIQVGDKSLRFEPQTQAQGGTVCTPALPLTADESVEVTPFTIHARQMFGGYKHEGGLEGEMRFYFGSLTQSEDELTTAYMTSAGLTAGTGRPGVCYVAFGTAENPFYFGTVPTPKDITFILKHSPDALGVGMPDSDDANPAEIIYDLLTNSLRGLGLSTTLVDTSNFAAVAEVLKNEGLGLSCCFSDQDEVEDMIDDVLKHIVGILRISPTTGQYQIKLARNDYIPSDLPRISTSLRGAVYANAKDLKLSKPNYRETTNDIQITYRRFVNSPVGGVAGKVLTNDLNYGLYNLAHFDLGAQNVTAVTLYGDGVEIPSNFYSYEPTTGLLILSANSDVEEGATITVDFTAGPVFNGYKEATARWQDLASIQQSGEIRSQTYDYPFFTGDLAAARHVARLGQQLGRSLWGASWDMDRSGYGLAPGDVVRLNHQPMDEDENETELLDDEPFRIMEVDYGRLEDGIIGVSAVEDVWAEDVFPVFPAIPGSSGSGPTLVAPNISISQAANSAITICFFPADTNFAIKIQRATDANGTGQVTLAAALPGTTTCGTDTQTIGVTLYYRAQLVPTSSQVGYTEGIWTAWTAMTATSGTVAECTPTNPVFAEVAA